MFLRASPGVLGPHLMRDSGVSARSLCLPTGSYFLLLGLAQIPAGHAEYMPAPEAAYRAVFAFVALTMAAGLAFYLPLADIRPGDERAAADA